MDGYYTYIIEAMDGSLYAGFTVNLLNRFKVHEEGKGARYLRGKRKPRRFVFVAKFNTLSEAMRKENLIKKLSRNRKLELIESDDNQLSTLL